MNVECSSKTLKAYLAYKEVVNIHTQVLSVHGVEGVLCVYECRCACTYVHT
jgi:hypothetical protein